MGEQFYNGELEVVGGREDISWRGLRSELNVEVRLRRDTHRG